MRIFLRVRMRTFLPSKYHVTTTFGKENATLGTFANLNQIRKPRLAAYSTPPSLTLTGSVAEYDQKIRKSGAWLVLAKRDYQALFLYRWRVIVMGCGCSSFIFYHQHPTYRRPGVPLITCNASGRTRTLSPREPLEFGTGRYILYNVPDLSHQR